MATPKHSETLLLENYVRIVALHAGDISLFWRLGAPIIMQPIYYSLSFSIYLPLPSETGRSTLDCDYSWCNQL